MIENKPKEEEKERKIVEKTMIGMELHTARFLL